MIRTSAAALMLVAATACAPRAATTGGPIEVGVIAINDFHGNLEPPRLTVAMPVAGAPAAVPAGGAAYLAGAIATLRARHPHAITVSAGDMTGASPLASSLFLDEPTVAAMNLAGLDLNAAGNHEFDRGVDELRRLQDGGCARHTRATPCAVEPFAGARFRYLAGNSLRADGTSVFPGTAIRRFGTGARAVTIGFIGLTTRTTATLVSPAGIRGITFADEAATANAAVPALKAAGADAIVLLVHEGGYPRPETDPNACEGMSGPILAIARALDPAIGVVVSGHTHKAYVCDRPRGDAGSAPILLTSAGRYGTMVTDITLGFDPATRRLSNARAVNVAVQGEGFTAPDGTARPIVAGVPRHTADPAVATLVARYVAAAEPLSARPVGRLAAPLPRGAEGSVESPLGNLIADSQLAATRGQGAQVAFMNPAGVRTTLTPGPDGRITYGDIYAVQPFGNVLMVREYTGAQLLAILEQQFARAGGGGRMMLAVAGMTYAFDAARPAGSRILDARVGGRAVDPAARYRVTMNNFLAYGGDGFTSFAAGRDVADGPVDLDAVEAYFAGDRAIEPPATGRIADRTPR